MRTDLKPSSNATIAHSPWFKFPPEHGAVITFALSLLLSIGLSSDKGLSAFFAVIFLFVFASLHNSKIRITFAAVGVLAASLWQLPVTAIAYCLLALGRKLLSLFPNCSLDLKQSAALAGMALLPLSVAHFAPHESLEILSKYALFLHATMFGAATVFYFLRHKGFRFWIPSTLSAIFLLSALPCGAHLMLRILVLDLAKTLYLVGTQNRTIGLKHTGILETVYLTMVTLALYLN